MKNRCRKQKRRRHAFAFNFITFPSTLLHFISIEFNTICMLYTFARLLQPEEDTTICFLSLIHFNSHRRENVKRYILCLTLCFYITCTPSDNRQPMSCMMTRFLSRLSIHANTLLSYINESCYPFCLYFTRFSNRVWPMACCLLLYSNHKLVLFSRKRVH